MWIVIWFLSGSFSIDAHTLLIDALNSCTARSSRYLT
jgi:hypothetical protein